MTVYARDVLTGQGFMFVRCHDTRYVGDGVWEDVTPDEPGKGSTWHYGRWDEATAEDATHILVDWTAYSDYGGSSAERSNHRSLREDYPDAFIDVFGGHGTRALLIPADYSVSDEDYGYGGTVLEALIALEDYPLYNEEDHANLEMEEADAAWSSWLGFDVRRALVTEHGCNDETVEWLDDNAPEWLEGTFHAINNEQPQPYYLEDATNIYFPHQDDTVAELARRIMAGCACAREVFAHEPNETGRVRCAGMPEGIYVGRDA